ncbi:MAG: ribonuclease HII [Rhodospirillales bacterium]|jgi:ribonuclease HII
MPDFSLEEAARRNGVSGMIVGVDEVGRGPWAGPVFACAVCLFDRNAPQDFLDRLDDSKKLNKNRREKLFLEIKSYSIAALAEASVEEIDRFNILEATKLAMARAIANLEIAAKQPVELALVDGNQPLDLSCSVQNVVKGDGISASIAAASIYAKVARDRYMAMLATQYPGYGWERNAGYGVVEHSQALRQLGPTIHHRKTFRPVAKLLTPIDS